MLKNKLMLMNGRVSQRFALKKTSLGVASVLVGLTLLGYGGVAHADAVVPGTPTPTSQPAPTATSSQQQNPGATVKPVEAGPVATGAPTQGQPTAPMNNQGAPVSNVPATSVTSPAANQPGAPTTVPGPQAPAATPRSTGNGQQEELPPALLNQLENDLHMHDQDLSADQLAKLGLTSDTYYDTQFPGQKLKVTATVDYVVNGHTVIPVTPIHLPHNADGTWFNPDQGTNWNQTYMKIINNPNYPDWLVGGNFNYVIRRYLSHTVTIKFIDDVTGKVMSTVADQGYDGDPLPAPTATIDHYLGKHYQLVSNGVAKVTQFTNADQTYEVHFTHATTPVTDQEDVTEVIHYVYAGGGQAAPDHVSTVQLTRTGVRDEVTGETSWNDWTDGDFAPVTSPTLVGYQADPAGIGQLVADGKSTRLERTVTYTRVATPATPGQTPNQPAAPNGGTQSGPTTNGAPAPAKVVTAPVTVSHQQAAQPAQRRLPQTGDQTNQLGLLGLASLSLLGLLGLQKREEH